MRIFLGGTCNNSTWREILIPMLEKNNIDYFNPVVDDWTEDDFLNEEREKDICDICLYVLTPLMTGVYSIAEVVDDSNNRPKKTALIVLPTDGTKEFDCGQLKSLTKVASIVSNNGAKTFLSLQTFIKHIT